MGAEAGEVAGEGVAIISIFRCEVLAAAMGKTGSGTDLIPPSR
jgi:hypothetical protein